jgi:Transcriptional repressor TCF25
MSSRALRKLKREEEEARRLAALQAEQAAQDGSDEAEDDVEDTSSTRLKLKHVSNAFDMLDGANEDDYSESGGEVDQEADGVERTTGETSNPPKPTKAKKKKKKQKKKAREKAPVEGTGRKAADKMDDIDRALQELSTKEPTISATDADAVEGTGSGDRDGSWEAPATKLLGIDSRNLNPVNEMKSLFGNIALEGSSTGRASPRTPQRQREPGQQGGVDLGTALTGRYSPASKGRELGALANRRNVFVQGHEDWPLGTSGGLSMETDKTNTAFGRQFSIIHNNAYMDVQREFHLCVESMQAESMIRLLMLNPYHIATLLQVSEIAKHQGDHSVSGDLLERALFSIGRSVHSTFPAALREGMARLSFNDPKNRELYLTMWRYIQNLSMRGTWRTAFEWTKALLQLDTLKDPFGMTLMIDQLALRGRQYAAFIDLCSESAYGKIWSHLPNIQISLSLAYLRSSQPKLARQTLALAMHKYPYILSALASSLDITPLPKYLWAKVPTTEAEKLYTELYVTRAKDLWNSPETTSLIAEVAETTSHYKNLISTSTTPAKLEISLEDARHIMLLEIPSLIALLPRKFTTMPTSSSDVLPPPDSLSSNFTLRAPGSGATDASAVSAISALLNAATAGATVPIGGASGLLTRVLNWFHAPADPNEELNEHGETDGAAALRELHDNVPPEVVQEIFRRHILEEHEEDDEHDGRYYSEPESPDEEAGMGSSRADALFRRIVEAHGADDESDEATDDENDSSLPDLEDIPTVTRGPRNQDEATDDENDSSLPDLEDIPTVAGESRNQDEAPIFQGPPQRSMVATVEDDSDSDDYINPNADHDAEYLLRPHPPPTHRIFARMDPSQVHDVIDVIRRAGSADDSASRPESNDPQRIQRWLISTGLQKLQDDESTMQEYVARLKGLRQRDRDWTLGIVRQRAGAEVAERVRRELEG